MRPSDIVVRVGVTGVEVAVIRPSEVTVVIALAQPAAPERAPW